MMRKWRLRSGKLRGPVNGLTHLVVTIVAAFALVVLLHVGHSSITKELSLLVYGSSLTG